MPKFNDNIQTSLGGEVSPKLYGRNGSELYKNSLKKLQNMWVFPQGGSGRRSGTVFITDELFAKQIFETSNIVKPILDGAKLFDFVVSETESYVVIVGESSADSEAAVHVYNPSNERMLRVRMDDNFADFDGLQSGKTSENFLTDATIIKDIQMFQKGDVAFFTHPSLPPFQLVRFGEDNFQLLMWYERPEKAGVLSYQSTLNVAKAWPMTRISNFTIMSSASGVGSGRTLTASQNFFTANMIGTPMAVQDSGTVGYVVITAVASATSATATVLQALPGTSAYGTWFEAAWSAKRGWPSAGCFWNSSMLMGDSAAEPGQIWRSQVGDIYEFVNDKLIDPAGSPTDSDPVNYTIASEKNNYIRWMVPQRNSFLVGTAGREYSVTAFSTSDINIEPQTDKGSEYVQPVVVAGMPVYAQIGGRKLREMIFQERINGYISPETSERAEHFSRQSQELVSSPLVPRIKGMCYQKTPNDLIWVWDNNGYLYACTRRLEGEITAFHRHEIGGSFGDNSFGFVISCTAIPNPSGGGYDLYALVKRTVDSSTVVYFEKLSPEFDWFTLHPDTDTKDREPVFMDSAKIFRIGDTATFYASYSSSIDADTSVGSGTGTASGTPVLAEGLLNLQENPPSYVDYDGTDNADHAQVGCIRFDWYYYHESATSNEALISICKAAGDDDNLITIDYSIDEGFAVTIKDSTGTDIIPRTAMGGPNFNDLGGTAKGSTEKVTVELNYDLTNGATRLFINGKQYGNTLTQTGTRDSDIDLLRIGAAFDASFVVQSAFRNLLIFDSVQHTEDHELYDYTPDSTTIGNLAHLEGETVVVLADGKYLGEKTVSSGAITLDDTGYSTIIVGLSYEHILTTLPLEAGSGVGTAKGRPTRVDTIAIQIRETADFNFGRDESNTENYDLANPDDDPNNPITLVTDTIVLPFNGDYDVDSSLTVKGSKPLPCNITSIAARGQTYD